MKSCFHSKNNFTTLIAFLIVQNSFSQTDSLQINLANGIKLKKASIGLEITASILPKAKIINTGGNYTLQSLLQSSYDLGINYIRHINSNLSISTGFHFMVGKWNFFLNVPQQDLSPYNYDGRRIIELKDLWGSFRFPLLIDKSFGRPERNRMFIRSGINLRYSGLMSDLEVSGGGILDSTNQLISLFSGSFKEKNNYKPWVTFLAGAGKSFTLKNHNKISVCLQADISHSYFLKGNYEITIPRKPVSPGVYKINGTSMGLSVQYVFTGTNKQFILSQKRTRTTNKPKEQRPSKKENILESYVFKGNHIQFNFAPLSTFKARLKNQSGDHPVNTNAAPGLLLSFKYSKNFNNIYSLITGPEAILSGRNFITSFNKNDFSPPLIADYNTKGLNSLADELILSLPVMIEKRWLYSKTKFVFADAGLRLNFSLGADFDSYIIYLSNTANGFYNAGGVEVVANNDAKPWVSFPVNAGHSWLLKNNNLLQLAICSNVSFTKYVNGTYQIDIPGKPLTTGKYSSTGSFIGLSVNYVFTNANYRIRKAFEKKEYK